MFDDQAGWGTSEAIPTNDVIKDAMKKEQVIKCVRELLCLTLFLLTQSRDIVAYQDDLRGICTTFVGRRWFSSHRVFSFFLSSALRACEDY
jgi:hypothetical protein